MMFSHDVMYSAEIRNPPGKGEMLEHMLMIFIKIKYIQQKTQQREEMSGIGIARKHSSKASYVFFL